MANKKILKTLREVSAKLPTVEQSTRMKFLGSEILKHNPNAKDTEGKTLNAEKVYSCDATIRKNHYRAMKKIMKKAGISEVNRYIKEVFSLENGRRTMVNETIGKFEDRKNQLTNGF